MATACAACVNWSRVPFDAWLVVLTLENPEAASTAARVRPHVLRHTFGIHGVDADVPLDVV
jgi:site-specific recombinase XerD